MMRYLFPARVSLAQVRAALNLFVALSMLLSAAFPTAAVVQAAPASVVSALAGNEPASQPSVSAVSVDLLRERAPYLPGKAPNVAASSGAAQALGGALLPAWLADPNTGTAERGEAGTSLLPGWMSGADTGPATDPDPASQKATGGVSLLPGWYAESASRLPAAMAGAPFAPLGAAQCTPSSSLDLNLTIPPYPVSRGNTAGDVYTVTVKNNGTVSTTEVSLRIDPSAGFYYLGGSATVVSSISGTLTYVTHRRARHDLGDRQRHREGAGSRRDDDLHVPPGDGRRRGFWAVTDRRVAEWRPDGDDL